MTSTSARRRLGFLSNVPFTSSPDGPREGLQNAVELFAHAEGLGYDIGWIRQRHFDNYSSSPLTLLAAVSQRTKRIGLGTAVIPVRYEDPIRLAEDAATVDLLSNGRLELGISSGIPAFAHIFGPGLGHHDEAQRRIDRFLSALAGEVVGVANEYYPDGEKLTVRPHAAGLRDRVWYGAGSLATATKAGVAGCDLLIATVAPDVGKGFVGGQLEQIRLLRENWSRTDRAPRISAARLFLPARSKERVAAYQAYDTLRQSEGPSAARPAGAIAPRPGQVSDAGASLLGPVHLGSPQAVVDALLADGAVAESDELVAFLPPNMSHREYLELLEVIAVDVAPHLGWSAR